MWDGNLRRLDDRELDPASEIGSDYLCLRAIDGNKFELSMRGYEHLGNTSDFYDEDTDEEIIPDQIDGKEVVHRESNEYVLGGELVIFSDSDKMEFEEVQMPGLTKFLDSLSWKLSENTRSYDLIFNEVKKLCEEFRV